MAENLEFDDNVAKRFDWFYASEDVIRRRTEVLRALGAKPGDDVLDIGCGPGYYVAEIAGTVAPGGSVTGIDRSAAMLGSAERRCLETTYVVILKVICPNIFNDPM